MNSIQKRHAQTYRMTLVAILAAIVVVLQCFSNVIKIGPVSITLTLIPVVLGGCLVGKKWGAALGCLFGIVVTAFVVTGTDVGGNMLFVANPILTVLLCLVKGTAAGFMASVVYECFSKTNQTFAVMLAAMTAPIVNTGIFVAAMLVFYADTLAAWAGGQDIMLYILTGLAGWNFLVEFAVAAVLSPTIAMVIRKTKKI